MKLVIIDQNNRIVADYGEFTPHEAEGFFNDALSAMAFRSDFPQIVARNEIQLRMLTDTLAQMGLLHGNPEAIQDWMRPYINNELQRHLKRENAFEKARRKIDETKQKAFDWIKVQVFGSASKLLTKLINHFTNKK